MSDTKKQAALRQAALKKRRREQGLLRVEYWLTVEQKAAVDKLIKGNLLY